MVEIAKTAPKINSDLEPIWNNLNKQKVKSKLFEPLSPAFIEEKRIFQSPQGKKLYKLRPIFSEGNFANLKKPSRIH